VLQAGVINSTADSNMLYFLYRLYFGKFERRVVSGYGRQIANDYS